MLFLCFVLSLLPAGFPSSSPPSDQAASTSSILLTQDFVAAARGLSEALAALLPSAAALADADPSQRAAAAAAATEAVQGLKSFQGRVASAKADRDRRSSEGGTASAAGAVGIAGAGLGSNPIPVQRSVTEGQVARGLMGPPAPVDMSARDAAAAAALAAGETAFARQQEFAFSPTGSSGFDAPVHSAALPVPIGPRRSFDGSSSGCRPQLSWTARPRAVSAGGGPPVDAFAAAAGSYDSLNMSLPQRSLDEGFLSSRVQDGSSSSMLTSLFKQEGVGQQQQQQQQQQSPQEQQMRAASGADAGEGTSIVNGVQPAAGVGSPWAAEPVLLRQPSRRKSMELGGRPSFDERRQQ